MKTVIDLPDPLFRRLKATTAVNGISLKSFIIQAVEKSLDTTENDWRRIITTLPQVPEETLEIIRQRVEDSDREDIDFPFYRTKDYVYSHIKIASVGEEPDELKAMMPRRFSKNFKSKAKSSEGEV